MPYLHLMRSTAERMETDARTLSFAAYRARYGAMSCGRMTWEQVHPLAPDADMSGQVVIEHPDERERRYNKPIALVDNNGPRPIIYIGGGEEHLGDMVDELNERRHYGIEPAFDRKPKVDIQAAVHDFEDAVTDWRAGRKTYGKRF